MAPRQERKQVQDTIRLASPLFYERDYFDFRNNTLSQRLIANKFVYLISHFGPNGRISMGGYSGYTGYDGILYNAIIKQKMMILPGDYYIFVADKPLDNYLNKINKDICSGPIKIVPDTKEVFSPGRGVGLFSREIYVERLFYCNHIIGNYYEGTAMLVRRYGLGKNNTKAIFIIGRLHGNEEGAENSIKIMEDYIKENPHVVPANTSVFILSPASKTSDRNISGIDPNRNFLDKDIDRLNETKAIAYFTKKIAQEWKSLTIISAHQYNNVTGQRKKNGTGFVFPLYDLTPEGLKDIEGKPGDYKEKMTKGKHYNNSKTSEILAKKFSEIVKFQYEPMWLYNQESNKAEMYPGEYIYFVSRLNKPSVNMIEYEIPLSDSVIDNNNTRNGLISYLLFLLGG
jgi:hypothetical protein